jgi:WD40 repeat protein
MRFAVNRHLVLVMLALSVACVPSPPSIQQGAPSDLAETMEGDSDLGAATDPLLGVAERKTMLPPILERITSENAGRLELLAELGKGAITDVAWSPAGDTLAVSTSLGVYLYDAESLEQLDFFATDEPQTMLDYSANGDSLASSSDSGELRVIDLEGRTISRSRLGRSSPPVGLEFLPTANRFAVVEKLGGEVHIIDAGSGNEVLTLAGGELDTTYWSLRIVDGVGEEVASGGGIEMRNFAVSPDGAYLAAVTDRSLRLWELDSGGLRAVVGLTASANSVAFSPDGKLMATGHYGGMVWIRDAGTGQPFRSFRADSLSVEVVQFTPDSGHLATFGWDGLIKLWDLELRQISRTMNLYTGYIYGSGRDSSIHFTQREDGWWMAVSAGGSLHLWSESSDSKAETLAGHSGAIVEILPLADTASALTVSNAPTIWELEVGEIAGTLEMDAGSITCHAFTADTERLLLGSSDGRVYVWDLGADRLAEQLSAHNGPVTALATGPGGDLYATGGEDNRVRVWQMGESEPLWELRAQEQAITNLYFSSDGSALGSLGYETFYFSDPTIRIWDVGTGALLNTLANPELWKISPAAGEPAEMLALFRSESSRTGSASSSRIVNDRNWKTVQTFEGGNLSYSGDGKRLVTSDDSGKLWVWNWEGGQRQAELQVYAPTPFQLPIGLLNYDGSVVITTGGAEPKLRVWNVARRAELQPAIRMESASTALAIGFDDKLLFIGSSDGVLRVWGVVPWSTSE